MHLPYANAAIAVQSFGDLKNFNSHLHAIHTDSCFFGNGSFKACPKPNTKDLEDLFRYEVFNMLKSEGKSNDVVIENFRIGATAALRANLCCYISQHLTTIKTV